MKKEIFPALEWMQELQDPEIQLKDRTKFGPWFFGQRNYHATAIASSFAYGRISILQGKSSKGISQSESTAQESIAKHLSSTVYVQSESNSNFYLANLLLLKSTSICQSFAGGTETDVTKVQQLKGSTKSYSISLCTPIYYVNFASAFVSQSYFFENTKSKVVNLQSKTISNNRFFAAPAGPFAKLLKLTSISICQSKSLAEITRAFNLYSTIISQSLSKASDSITRKLSSNIIAQSISKPNKNLKINLTSNANSISKLSAPKSIKQGLHSRFYSESIIGGSGIITRPLSAKSNSQSFPKQTTTLSKKININSKMVSQSISRAGETVTRLVNGVAESISIAQRSFGSVHRLFVSNSVSPSFSKATGGYITKNIHSSMYSQVLVHGSETVTRPLAAKSASQNPFHGNQSVLLELNSKAAAATISSGQENISKPLAAKGISQNPFHSNPNIFRQLQAKAQAESFAKANGINKKLGLSAKSISQSEAHTQEIVSRPLASKIIAQEYSDADIRIARHVNSVSVTQSNSNVQEKVLRPMQSKTVVQSVSIKSNQTIKRLLASTTQIDTHSLAQNPNKKINLLTKAISKSDASGNEIVSRKLSSKSVDQSQLHSNGLNILVNMYGSAISTSSARSDLMNKRIDLHSEIIIQSYIAATDNYLGNKESEVTFAEPRVDQDAINLAPFNYGTNKQI